MNATRARLRNAFALVLLAAMLVAAPGRTGTTAAAVDQPEPAGPSATGTGFTYQGSLWDSGSPANGLYDFEFRLHGDAGCTTQVGSTLLVNALLLRDGLFTVSLDFGAVYDGDERWLQVSVRSSGTGPFTVLGCQAITATPYASYALQARAMPWSGLTGVPAGFADGVDDDTLDTLSCSASQVAAWNGTVWVCRDTGQTGGWLLGGNAGTTAGSDFLGTTDDQPLELRVNGSRAWRLEPRSTSPNVLGGYGGNQVAPAAAGAAIGGGGEDLAVNQVTASFGTVGGGRGNSADAYAATVSGGEGNQAGGSYATMAGGTGNTAGGSYASISGGRQNSAGASYASIGGGAGNVVTATHAVVGGGLDNLGGGSYAAVGGGRGNASLADYATISGGGPADPANPTTTNNRALDRYASIGGGGGNVAGSADGATDSAEYAAVGGGQGNTAGAGYATVSGGAGNSATAYAATTGGGSNNSAAGSYATAGGGSGNQATGSYATVGGGSGNSAAFGYATIAGGSQNSASVYGSIGGGASNTVSAGFGTVPGGLSNVAGGSYSFAAGRQSKAQHAGAFVWADSTAEDFASTAADQFLVRASGGVGIGTNSPSEMLTVAGSAMIEHGGLAARGVYGIQGGTVLEAPSAVYAAGTQIYVTSAATNTLAIFDGSDPDAPRLLGAMTSDLHGPSDVQVLGQRAYVASALNGKLVIIDVSDPSSPDSLSSRSVLPAKPAAVYVSGNYAYVAADGTEAGGTSDGLAVFDVADASAIMYRGTIDTHLDGPSDVYVAGSYAYVTSRGNDRLAIFDVSDPESIGARGFTSEFLDAPAAVQVSGDYAYVVPGEADSLVIFDVSDPDHPAHVGHVSTALVQPRSLFVSGRYAYVTFAGDPATASDCGLAVFDVSNPAAIGIVSVIDMSDVQPAPPKPAAVTGSGPYIYVANESQNSMAIYEVNHLIAPAAQIDSLQAGALDVTENAVVNNDLDVRGGLSVGPGGALIGGELAVTGRDNSYILGALSIGSAGEVITATGGIEEQHLYPTRQLDVSGEARFRINGRNNLLISNPTAQNADAAIDFIGDEGSTVVTPTARILFDASDPFTHTTSIVFATQAPDDEELLERLVIEGGGNLHPTGDAQYSLGEAEHRWSAVYAANGVIQTSDGRLKRDVADLPQGLEAVARLRPVTFEWTDGPDDGRHFGFIAQEVQAVLPEIVEGDERSGPPLGLSYAELVPVLVKAVQEQQATIADQSSRIEALEARLDAVDRVEGRGRFPPGWLGYAGLSLGVLAFLGRRLRGPT